MILKEKILQFMQTEAYKPLTAEDLAEQMQLKSDELKDFWQVIAELEENADIIRTRYDKFGVPERMNLVVGKLSTTSKGFGFVIPEKVKAPEDTDVFIAPDDMLTAMHHDRVVARVHGHKEDGRSREGEIIRVVERANKRVVGTYEASRNFGFVIPDDKRLGQDIFIPKDKKNNIKSGAKVVVEITKWPEKKRSAEGVIVEVLGYTGDVGVDILSIIKKHNLPLEFPTEVMQAADNTPEAISEEEIQGRKDLRHLPIVTIDGDDAKDLDDGVYVKSIGDGKYLLGVYIADVSYYVRENEVLDKEARLRGTSVYLADRVVPMLPKRLSNGICSLNAHEDRLAMSIHMEINELGQVLKYEIFPSVIRVKKRFTYNVVTKMLVDRDDEYIRENAELLPMLEEAEQLCKILQGRRKRRGAIDFDFPELKVKLDDQGKPIAIVKRVRNLSESIIEEFMLVANETVAEHMYRLKVPFMYRVHEPPEEEKMVKLNKLLHNFGLSLNKVSEVPPMALQKILAKIAGQPEERIISTIMLRSLKQARYEANNAGHFGLAAEFYTHFTSPIRRYPDLIVHRLLRESFAKEKMSEKRRNKLNDMLPEIAFHSSERERGAAEAERETIQLKIVEYMTQFIGEKFEGVISSVTAFGMFVELDNGVEGLIRVSSMDDDYYQYVEEQYSLIGERTRKIYRLGDKISVVLVRVNIEERNMDFVLEGTKNIEVYKSPIKKPIVKVDKKKEKGFKSAKPKVNKAGKDKKPKVKAKHKAKPAGQGRGDGKVAKANRNKGRSGK